MNDIDAIATVIEFQGESLTKRIADLESAASGTNSKTAAQLCTDNSLGADFMNSALRVKRLAGQINVIIHAAGILSALPRILEPNEFVVSLSLGAGNSGRAFDLETNLRVAEFKFIDWQGGSETIRQNALFKDFFLLAEHQTDKIKNLYVVGLEHPLKFLTGRRALSSVLSRNPDIAKALTEKYGDNLKVVKDYYTLMQTEVAVTDVSDFIGRRA